MDGESDAQRKERLHSLWRKLDTTNAGYLDLRGLRKGLMAMSHPLKDADGMIRDMLTACDIDHDGKISYEEFCRFCIQTEKELWQLFQSIDRDHSGNLDKAELSAAFERAGVAVSNARLDRFFGYIDKNHDGIIDFSEWRDFLLFIPANSPGMRAVFSYYQTTAKISAEGDVHMSDEAIQGLGTILNFLKTSLFGAIIHMVKPAQSHDRESIPGPITTWERGQRPPVLGPDHGDHEQVVVTGHQNVPITAAQRKVVWDRQLKKAEPEPQAQPRMKLTDLIPDVGYFIAGGLAGVTSRTATAPLDRLKVYLIAQTGTAKEAVNAAKSGRAVAAVGHGFRSLWTATKELWAVGGMRNLFAGNGLNVLKVMPESAVKFGSYEAAKRAIARLEGHNDPKRISTWATFAAGGTAGMISQAAVYPLDTLKFQIQCEIVPGGEQGNKLLWHTAKKMWARNGFVTFYKGLPMGLVGMFPYAAIDLSVFETLKKRIIARNRRLNPQLKHDEDALPGNFALALIGGFSGAIGASVVYPINLLRTRLQSQGTASHPMRYTGIADVTRRTLRNEGVRGLFKGLTPNLLKVVPAVSITYVVYENTKKALHLH